jgi:hypothetical protein
MSCFPYLLCSTEGHRYEAVPLNLFQVRVLASLTDQLILAEHLPTGYTGF